MDNLTTLSIGEVARRVGIATSAIRFYESAGLLPPPARVGGQRRFHANVVDRLRFIQIARGLGFSLGEIETLFRATAAASGRLPLSHQWRDLAQHKIAEIDSLLARAQEMRRLLVRSLECSCLDLSDCMDCVIANCEDI